MVAASLTGVLQAVPGPAIALLVATGIIVPALAYFRSARIRASVEAFGVRNLTLLHAWRIGAAFLFFHYGAQGLLPDRFVLHAAWGDLVAGLAALAVALTCFSRSRYLAVHAFGLADFILAVGTGLYFTLFAPEAIAAILELPLVLIPLFGVGISGATHLIAFDLLLRRRGLPD